MKALQISLVTLLCVAAGALPAYATAYDDLAKCERAMAGVHSYRATLQASGSTAATQMEIVAPNRFHVTMFGGRLQFVVIDSKFWAKDIHGWKRLTYPPQMTGIGDLERLSHLSDKTKFAVSDLGIRNGYHALLAKEKSGDSQSIVSLRADHLPATIETRTKRGSFLITYSDFNSPITIVAPRT